MFQVSRCSVPFLSSSIIENGLKSMYVAILYAFHLYLFATTGVPDVFVKGFDDIIMLPGCMCLYQNTLVFWSWSLEL